ncbi:hypothetical protein [Halovenus halobia]|uniref:hypothetical protein n=1 Tax=Halovenus halobia TaxID=3396622 RepID=UPI003F574FB3
MNISYDDRLEVLGLATAAFVAIVALGTLVGQPWATAEGTAPALVQTVGLLLSFLVAAVIVLVTQGYDLADLRAMRE